MTGQCSDKTDFALHSKIISSKFDFLMCFNITEKGQMTVLD